MASTGTGSARWTRFHEALQLAIQASVHRWTYENFTECFSLWCEEQPESSSAVYHTVSQHMESVITNTCEELMQQFQVKPNLDKLHAVVTEARARRRAGYDGKDVWKEDLHPTAAVHAKTIPLLEKERDRLREELEKLDARNLELQAEMQANVNARDAADDAAAKLFDLLDEACAKWNEVPMEEIQSWTLQAAESISNSTPH